MCGRGRSMFKTSCSKWTAFESQARTGTSWKSKRLKVTKGARLANHRLHPWPSSRARLLHSASCLVHAENLAHVVRPNPQKKKKTVPTKMYPSLPPALVFPSKAPEVLPATRMLPSPSTRTACAKSSSSLPRCTTKSRSPPGRNLASALTRSPPVNFALGARLCPGLTSQQKITHLKLATKVAVEV